MKYERFEDLPVWNKAIDLTENVYFLTQHRFYSQPGDLCNQMCRASLSVSNNIAEGFERGTTAELLSFLYIARGSAGENRSMLRFSRRLKSQISNLKSQNSFPWPNRARAKFALGRIVFRTVTSKASGTWTIRFETFMTPSVGGWSFRIGCASNFARPIRSCSAIWTVSAKR